MGRRDILLSALALICMLEVVRCYVTPVDAQDKAPMFRYDYQYSEDVEGWFKLHRIPRNFHEAKRRCTLEGADLASPTSKDMVHAMSKVLLSSPRWNGVYIGIHATFATGEYLYNGIPLDRMPVEWVSTGPFSTKGKDCILFHNNSSISNEDCSLELPFMCFKKKTKDFFLNACGTIDNDYKLDERSGSCYKFHGKGLDWSNSVKTCAAEGGHLAVVNSDTEITILQSIFNNQPPGSVDAEFDDSISLGFIDLERNRKWTTVLGKTLAETYDSWQQGEPNNAYGGEYCGNLRRSGRLNDAKCTSVLAFICEKDPASLLGEPTKNHIK